MPGKSERYEGLARLEKPFSVRFIQNGASVAGARVMFISGALEGEYGEISVWDVVDGWQDESQESVKDLQDSLAEITPGTILSISGSLSEREWTGQDGKKRTTKTVAVRKVGEIFISKRGLFWERKSKYRAESDRKMAQIHTVDVENIPF